MARIHITPQLLAQIQAAAETAYPRECCGLLIGIVEGEGEGGVGESFTVTAIEPSANVEPTGAPDRFEIDPGLRIRLQRTLRGDAEAGAAAIIGHYHSHPDHPPEPSATDRAMAHEPEMVWLITTVEAGKAGQSRAFTIAPDGAVTELDVVEGG